MHVVATAGHVDHGKSTLVTALTGTDPDRLAEERRRGLTIELGFAWTALPGVGEVAFVDVPGHERFLSTMLAGVGPVPVVLLVVAADDPWMPQAAEHLAALDALGVRRGVVAITRADLADPGPAAARARAAVDRTGLRGAPLVVVSGRTGAGLPGLRAALAEVLAATPEPGPGPVRVWVDRRFTAPGAGTVVTGTLPAGRIAVGDLLDHAGETVRVRAMQSLGRPVRAAQGVARVALNLTGPGTAAVARGSALTTPGAWHATDVLDVRLTGDGVPPQRPLLHVGAAALTVRHRPLGPGLARLTLPRAVPLRVGDRGVLRDPGTRVLWGVLVLDPAPPPLTHRGDGARRAAALARATGVPDPVAELDRRELVPVDLLARLGIPLPEGAVVAGGWAMSPARAERARRAAQAAVGAHDAGHPLDPGVPAAALAGQVGLPDAAVLRAALTAAPHTPRPAGDAVPAGGDHPGLTERAGRVVRAGPVPLPPAVERAVTTLVDELAAAPFTAPSADRLRELGLDERALAAAARAGRLLRPGPGVVLAAGADEGAVARLVGLPQPFTTGQARERLGTSRRVALALLAHLDRRGLTRRLPDDRRVLQAGPGRADGPGGDRRPGRGDPAAGTLTAWNP